MKKLAVLFCLLLTLSLFTHCTNLDAQSAGSKYEYHEYTVAEGPSVYQLNRAVNDLIKQGWQPIGGVAVNPERSKYLQAMAK